MPKSLTQGWTSLACVQQEHLPFHELTASWAHLFQGSSQLSTHIPLCCSPTVFTIDLSQVIYPFPSLSHIL